MLIATLFTLLTALLAPIVEGAAACTKKQRVDGAKLIINSYNKKPFGQSAAGFRKLPVKQDVSTFMLVMERVQKDQH